MFEQATSEPARDGIGNWMPRVAIALAFVLFGLDKFPSGPNASWVRFFDQVGVGQWFRYFTVVVEVAGGVLVLLPATVRLGAAMLAVTMAVASLIHIFVIHQPANAIITGAFFLGFAGFWWSRRNGDPLRSTPG